MSCVESYETTLCTLSDLIFRLPDGARHHLEEALRVIAGDEILLDFKESKYSRLRLTLADRPFTQELTHTTGDSLEFHRDRVSALFGLLSRANLADSDELSEDWQKASDASQRSYFGSIAEAIKLVAGEAIYSHWCECYEHWCRCYEIDWSLMEWNYETPVAVATDEYTR